MPVEIKKDAVKKLFSLDNNVLWGLFIGITLFFTIILYPSLIVKPHGYSLGDVARKDIKVLKKITVPDIELTEEKQRLAAGSVLTVYDYDINLANDTRNQLQDAFSMVRILYNKNTIQPASSVQGEKTSAHDRVWQMKEQFEEMIGIPVSDKEYSILEKEKFSADIENLISRILGVILENGVVGNKELILSESNKGIVLRTIGTKEEKIIKGYKNIRIFYGPVQAKEMVRIIGKPLLKGSGHAVRKLVVDLTQRLMLPNITLNRSETEERKTRAIDEIDPIHYEIKAGEILIRKGEVVTKEKLLKIQEMRKQASTELKITSSIGIAMLLLCLLGITYILHIKSHDIVTRNQNKNLLFIAVTLVIFVFVAKISAPFSVSASHIAYCVPLAAGAMTVCIFLGIGTAIPFALIVSICTAIIFNNRFDIFIYFLLNSSMAAYWIQNCRERKVFIIAGLKLGLLNVILVTAIDVYLLDYAHFKLPWDWTFAFLGGLLAGIATAGLAPLMELAFGYTTDIKLLELANLDRPILQRLMIEAPGTYHHSVIVGTMVEAAAAAIGANPVLARVCGYYHDIGKVTKPLYFIENQQNGKNKHDKITPTMSSLIITAHIKVGVEIARENKLGQDIIDTIKQHHGTSTISFFYEKAKQLKGEEETVNIDDFRYPGPKPQTREAGLVMLADVLEAASRTLDNPTPSRIQGLVQNLINQVFSDGQLDNCELTLKDLNNIARSFNKILNGIYHHRIEYPEKHSSTNGKEKHGSPDRQQAKQSKDISEKNSKNGSGHLKRLGLS